MKIFYIVLDYSDVPMLNFIFKNKIFLFNKIFYFHYHNPKRSLKIGSLFFRFSMEAPLKPCFIKRERRKHVVPR